jgi:diguanylate cyclase (GGDEF)-like protein
MKILVVEDDEFVAKVLAITLGQQNYAVEVAADGEIAWDLIKSFEYDLILLDVILPKLDGISLCRQLRSQGYHMPILLLTGHATGHEKAAGLDAGADDYVVKPFDREELIARIRALLRRGNVGDQPILEWGALQLNPTSHEVTYDTHLLSLTPKEYALLELFLRNSRRVFSTDAILDHLWAYEESPKEEAVRTHIKGLRQKLKAAGAADVIETVYGIGYRLRPLEALSTQAHPAGAGDPAPVLPTASPLAAVWATFQAQVGEQVQQLQQGIGVILDSQSQIQVQVMSQAVTIAHTLAGSLGTFGLVTESQLARQIEHQLTTSPKMDSTAIRQLAALATALRQGVEQAARGGVPNDQSALVSDDRPLLLIIDRDRASAETLVQEAVHRGLRSTIAPDLTIARDQIYRHHPSLVVFDPTTAAQTEEGLALIAELNHRIPPIPVVLWADPGEAEPLPARPHQQPVLPKLQPVAELFETVNQALQQAEDLKQRVLIVDDDPKILAILKALLNPWGVKITTLQDPRQFIPILEACEPDLLILDVEMPYVSGIELCRQVREDSRWGGLPIVVLTAHTEATIVNQVLAAGANDFVSKPIVELELVTRIIHRLEHCKLLRNLAETDPLTGLANYRKSIEILNHRLAEAERHQHPLCFVIVSIRGLQQVNDRYGRLVGDAVVRQVGQVLRQYFPRTGTVEGMVARWGGKEFVILLDHMTHDQAIPQIFDLVEKMSQLSYTTAEQNKIRITFNFGVAQYPVDGTDQSTLYRSASRALEKGIANPDLG